MKIFEKRFLDKVEKTDSCWLWLGGKVHNGYGKFSIDNKYYRAHRVSYEMYKGPIPDGMIVCHSCDIRNCVNPDHLWLGTVKDNQQDMMHKCRGKQQFIKKNKPKNTKLTEDQVFFIKTSNLTGKELAQQFDVSPATISSIKQNRNWAYVGG